MTAAKRILLHQLGTSRRAEDRLEGDQAASAREWKSVSGPARGFSSVRPVRGEEPKHFAFIHAASAAATEPTGGFVLWKQWATTQASHATKLDLARCLHSCSHISALGIHTQISDEPLRVTLRVN